MRKEKPLAQFSPGRPAQTCLVRLLFSQEMLYLFPWGGQTVDLQQIMLKIPERFATQDSSKSRFLRSK